MPNANADVRFDLNLLVGLGRSKPGKRLVTALQLGALSTAVTLMFGCGQQATLDINAPSKATSGVPFTVTVTAMLGGSRDTIINSVVRFTSSDSGAILPDRYQFTASDAGSHTFTNGVTLVTAGSQTVTATIIDASALTATANVTVSTTTAKQF